MERVLSLATAEEFYGQDDYVELRHIIPDGILTEDQIREARDRAFANQFASKHLISKSGAMTAFYVKLERLGEKQKRDTVLAMIKTARQMEGPHFTVHYSGSSLVEVEMNRLSERDFNLFVPVIIVLIMVFIMILFRRITLAVLCQINLIVILLWGVGFFVFCGETFNIITNAMGAILLAIAIADSVHILSHLQETGQTAGLDPVAAIRHTLRQVWFPCLFTSLTTGAGFISFYASDIRPVAMLGLFSAVSVIFAFFLSVTVLPAMMVVIRQVLPSLLSPVPQAASSPARPDWAARSLMVCARIATRHKNILFMLFLSLMVFSAAGILRIKFETHTFHYLPDTNRIKSDLLVLEKNFGGTIPFVVVIRSENSRDFSDPDIVKQEFQG